MHPSIKKVTTRCSCPAVDCSRHGHHHDWLLRLHVLLLALGLASASRAVHGQELYDNDNSISNDDSISNDNNDDSLSPPPSCVMLVDAEEVRACADPVMPCFVAPTVSNNNNNTSAAVGWWLYGIVFKVENPGYYDITVWSSPDYSTGDGYGWRYPTWMKWCTRTVGEQIDWGDYPPGACITLRADRFNAAHSRSACQTSLVPRPASNNQTNNNIDNNNNNNTATTTNAATAGLVVVSLVAIVGLLGALVTRQQRRKRYHHGNPQSWQRWADEGYELTLMEDTSDPMATQH